MKKILVSVLIVLLFLSIGYCAYAIDSPSGDSGWYIPVRTATLPSVINSNGAKLTSYNDKSVLSAEEESVFKEAKNCVGDGAPAGMSSRYLFYAEAPAYPTDITIAVQNTEQVVIKLYSNGFWEQLTLLHSGDDYTFTLPCAGPVSVYTA